MTHNAPWAARYGHTSVIDSAGNIYVIGGYGKTYYNDTWMSADKGETLHAARTAVSRCCVLCAYVREHVSVCAYLHSNERKYSVLMCLLMHIMRVPARMCLCALVYARAHGQARTRMHASTRADTITHAGLRARRRPVAHARRSTHA